MTRRKRSHVRHQPRLPEGPRQAIGTAVEHRIERAIEREMTRYGVSRSFVCAVALAYTFGIDLDPAADYKKG